MESLAGMQCEDGGWKAGYLYSIPVVGKLIFDRGFTTALAVQVIEESRLDIGKTSQTIDSQVDGPSLGSDPKDDLLSN
jgi:hypothetical protein